MKVGPRISEVVIIVNKMVIMMMILCGGVGGEIFAFYLVSDG
jgi:hypothetical protein